MAKLKVSGFSEASKKIGSVANRAENLENTKYGLFEVVNPSFIQSHTDFANLTDYLRAGGFHISCADDLHKLDGRALDAYIAKTTGFSGWNDLFDQASDDFIFGQLGL